MHFFRHSFFPGRLACVLTVFLLTACGGTDDDLPLAFSATLGAAEEVPPNTSTATGIGLVTVDADRRTLTASVVAAGMVDSEAHIHEAPPGVSGPVAFPLARNPGTVVWSTRSVLTEAQLAALQHGNYYFNVHSPSFPAGEIRGQIYWVLPSSTQLAQLHQLRGQSALLDQQLEQVQEIEDADWWFTGVGLGLRFGW